ncbi:hypothetical protein ACFQ1Q_01655 [Winogradskyella litorisediminis]|uniref:DUF4625 domain-containing protein n=1 Tax=Winogradskyella litorisediminis TaxID=1156618 RepID=A0ABW3N5N5_9FLAO
MKNRVLALICILAITLSISCEGDDDATQRGSETIEVFIDGATVPVEFSTNITADDFPVAPQTGFSNIFRITSQDTSTNPFLFQFGPSNANPFTVTVPSSETISGPVSGRLQIFGVDIDDAAANNLTFSYVAFGPNTGDTIEINITGTYFDNSSVQHTISVVIDIVRD